MEGSERRMKKKSKERTKMKEEAEEAVGRREDEVERCTSAKVGGPLQVFERRWKMVNGK